MCKKYEACLQLNLGDWVEQNSFWKINKLPYFSMCHHSWTLWKIWEYCAVNLVQIVVAMELLVVKGPVPKRSKGSFVDGCSVTWTHMHRDMHNWKTYIFQWEMYTHWRLEAPRPRQYLWKANCFEVRRSTVGSSMVKMALGNVITHYKAVDQTPTPSQSIKTITPLFCKHGIRLDYYETEIPFFAPSKPNLQADRPQEDLVTSLSLTFVTSMPPLLWCSLETLSVLEFSWL